ncbi:MAG TPA: GntR family transcriptional regulator [Planctomycetaceae bacterium]|nr:GntR family transcriptional regulator [Planctomycetaceae bacterium]
MTTHQPDTLHCDHGRRRQAIVASVLADVFQRRLAAGQHLVTQHLAERFGVSHTPVREALIVLEAMGVLDLVPNRGAVVRSVAARDIREICQVRRALECEAVRRACGRVDLAKLRALRAELERMTVVPARAAERFIKSYIAKARDLDSRLHDLIAASCGNAFLAKELNRLKVLFRAFRDVSWEFEGARNDFRRLAEEAREHLAIVEALLDGDGRAAAKAMSRHIRSGMTYWSRSLPEQIEPASSNGSRRRASSNGNGRLSGNGRRANRNGR